MDWETKYLTDLDMYEHELEILTKTINVRRNAHITTNHNQGMLNLELHRRNRIMGSVPVYGSYCHIKSKTTIIK